MATHLSSTASVAGLDWVHHCSPKPLIDTRTEPHGHKDSSDDEVICIPLQQGLWEDNFCSSGTCHCALAPSTKFSSSLCSCCGKKSPRPAGAKQGSWKTRHSCGPTPGLHPSGHFPLQVIRGGICRSGGIGVHSMTGFRGMRNEIGILQSTLAY